MSEIKNGGLRALALALCATLVLVPVAQAEAMMANTGLIRATITVGARDVPVPSIAVRVVDLTTAEQVALVRTDATGTIELPDLPFGSYHVSARAPEGFVASAGPLVAVSADAATAEVAITLAPAQEGQEGEQQATEEDCEDGDDECVAAAAAAAAQEDDDDDIGLLLLGVLGAAGIALGIAGVTNQGDGGPDVITQ